MAEDFEIQLNGENRKLERPIPVDRFLETLGMKEGRVAVELNRQIVKREDWPTTLIQPGDVVEVVHFVGGGSW